jgi:raffinose/stachyose/melibiose transport system permease protein
VDGKHLPFSVFLYAGFMKSIPRDLDKAGIIEGCRPLSLFARLLFALLQPVTTTNVILAFTGIWNDFQMPL